MSEQKEQISELFSSTSRAEETQRSMPLSSLVCSAWVHSSYRLLGSSWLTDAATHTNRSARLTSCREGKGGLELNTLLSLRMWLKHRARFRSTYLACASGLLRVDREDWDHAKVEYALDSFRKSERYGDEMCLRVLGLRCKGWPFWINPLKTHQLGNVIFNTIFFIGPRFFTCSQSPSDFGSSK